jgi:hypothetical protein
MLPILLTLFNAVMHLRQGREHRPRAADPDAWAHSRARLRRLPKRVGTLSVVS